MTTIRLACSVCDRDDMDGITPDQLAELLLDGWEDISAYQSFEDSCRTYDHPADEPPGYSVFDWFTHLGTCPECVVAQESWALGADVPVLATGRDDDGGTHHA